MALSGPGETSRDAVPTAARVHDNDRYLAALLAPREARGDLMALAAFSGETARIPHLVSDPTIGEIRLQWWRDALHAGQPTGNPVADAMIAAIGRHALPQGLIAGLLEARAFDLYADPMPDAPTFRAYLAKSEGALLELALRVLASPAPDTRTVLAAGQALGLTRVLAALPHMLAKGRCALPADRLAAAGVGAADLAATPIATAARALVAALVADARHNLATVRADWPQLSRAARTALLPLALIEPQLRVLERREHHPGRDVASVLPLTRVWRIWVAHARGRL
jgi:phytoene synthase